MFYIFYSLVKKIIKIVVSRGKYHILILWFGVFLSHGNLFLTHVNAYPSLRSKEISAFTEYVNFGDHRVRHTGFGLQISELFCVLT